MVRQQGKALTLKLTYCRCWACFLMICWIRSGWVERRYDVAGWLSSNSNFLQRSGVWKTSFQRRHTDEALARSTRDRCWKTCRTTWWGRFPQSSAGVRAKLDAPRFCLFARSSREGKGWHFDLRPVRPCFILKQITTLWHHEIRNCSKFKCKQWNELCTKFTSTYLCSQHRVATLATTHSLWLKSGTVLKDCQLHLKGDDFLPPSLH